MTAVFHGARRRIHFPTAAYAALIAAALFAVGTVLLAASPTRAHEGREVAGGKFSMEVGFLTEPTYEGMLNAVFLMVTRNDAGSDAMDMAMESDGDDHDHEGDADADADADAMMGMDANSDVATHGAVFISNPVPTDGHFEYEVPESLAGMTVAYHIHPGDWEGSFVVGADASAGGSDAPEILITADGLEPRELMVVPGDTVTWHNATTFAASVMSGPLESMSPEQAAAAMNPTTGHGAGVSGLSQTLEVEITHLSTGRDIVLQLNESAALPGHYEAPFIPTATGEFSFRFYGEIEGEEIDETFEAGPDTFDVVVSADTIQFPNLLPSGRELENAVDGARSTASTAMEEGDRASNSANIAIAISLVSIALGIGGIGFGGFAFMTTRNGASRSPRSGADGGEASSDSESRGGRRSGGDSRSSGGSRSRRSGSGSGSGSRRRRSGNSG